MGNLTREFLSDLCISVTDIAVEASYAVLKIYESKEHNNLEVELKKDESNFESPLTVADKKSNEIICAGLRQLEFEGSTIPIISEENLETPFSEREKYQRYWLVDPLDGTKEFIKRNGQFTVNIALIEKVEDKYEPVLGVVTIPVEHKIYYGLSKDASYVGSFSSSSSNWRSSSVKLKKTRPSISGNIKVIVSNSHMNKATEEYIKTEIGKDNDIIRCGSSIKFMKIAEQQADIYPRLNPCMEWDIGASHAILLGAGCNIYDINGKQIYYNSRTLKIESLISIYD